jgi:hypothetical protein
MILPDAPYMRTTYSETLEFKGYLASNVTESKLGENLKK